MRYLLLIAAVLLFSACMPWSGSHSKAPVPVPTASTGSAMGATSESQGALGADTSATGSVKRDGGVPVTCPVTVPHHGPGSADDRYGDKGLSTELWPAGVVNAGLNYVQSDGSIRMKFPWWREPGVVGKLIITGKRLDGVSPDLSSEIPPAYGQSGFQATYLVFPTEGCWQVTGEAGNARLTFVTWVTKYGSDAATNGS